MDVSLDDYIQQKGPKLGNRLGPKAKPGGPKKGPFRGPPRQAPVQTRKPNPRFTVTGVGSVKQRLGIKTGIPDARQKILQKTKFVDARSRIEQKKAHVQTLDVRNKINNAKAKKMDARQLLKARQQRQQPQLMTIQAQPPAARPGMMMPPGTGGPRFTVTGLGKVALKAGPVGPEVVHTIPTIHSGPTGIRKTIHHGGGHPHSTSPSAINASAVAGNIMKTISNENIGYPQEYPPEPRTGLRITRTMKPVKPKTVPMPQTYYEEVDEDDGDDGDYYDAPVGGMRSSRAPAPIQHVNPPRPTRAPKPLVESRKQTQQVPVGDVVSPTQGYRVIISNLHTICTQEDIVELFGAIGDMKKARLVKAGTAEVIYKEKADAQMAVKKYHQRELDGQPMSVVLGSVAAKPKPKPAPPPAPPAAKPAPSRSETPPSGPLRLGKHSGSDKVGANVETAVIHKALFKTSSRDDPARPVTFTVKI